jgi:hypothetical protein
MPSLWKRLTGDLTSGSSAPLKKRARLPATATFFILGGLLAMIYFIVAGKLAYFYINDLTYHGNPFLNFFISPTQLSSMVVKLVLLLPATILLAMGLTARASLDNISRVLNQKRLLVILSVVALIIFVLTINFVLQRTEVTDDELAMDLQAKIFLKGKLYVAPPVQNSFNNVFILRGDKFTGQYEFGQPVILALGMALGSPYIFTVLFAILQVLLVYKISLLLYKDKRLAALGSILVVLSPFFFLTGSTRLSHTTAAFFLYLFIYLFLKISERTHRGVDFLWAAVAGIAAGVAFNVRPWTALAFFAPFGVMGILNILKYRKPVFLKYCLMSLGFLLVIGLTLLYNKAITGSYLTVPYLAYNPLESPGFHALAGGGRHTPAAGIYNIGINIIKTNTALFGFPYSLAFLVFILVAKPKLPQDRLLISVLATFSFLYLFYHGMGVSDTGPVYCYELIGVLVILSSRAIYQLNQTIREKWPAARSFLSSFLVLSFIFAALTYDLEKVVQVRTLTTAIREPYVAIETAGLHRAVVFIQLLPNKGFVYGYRNNSPDFTDDVILCWLLGPDDNAKVIDRFPDRSYYVMRYDDSMEESRLTQVNREELLALGQKNK